MLYLAIPAHNEVATIGVLLWRLRTVLAEFPREYEVVVYDDASTDETADVAEQYLHAMPVTVLRGTTPIGYAGAVNALVRHIAAHTRYPRRDAMLLMQGDFTDPPGIVPEFARRFEGGADLVVGERTAVVDAPRPVRRLFTAAGWALKPFVRVEGVSDLTGTMRLMRISALRDLLRTVGDDAVCEGDSWTANADLLLRLVPHARRLETVPLEPTYGVRTRETRRVTVRDALAALRWAWRARGRRAVPTSAPEPVADMAAKPARPAPSGRRRDEPEVTADRLRERSRERDRLRGDSEPPVPRRDSRPGRERDGARPIRTEEQKAQKRQETRDDPRSPKREPRREPVVVAPETSTLRTPRPPRPERPARGNRPAPATADAELILDDPFAAPASRSSGAPRVVAADVPASEPHAQRDAAHDIPDRTSMSSRAPDDIDPGTENGDDDAAESANNAGDSPAVDEPQDAEGQERKRRRNRRSRRRKSRTRGESGETSVGEDDATATDAPREESRRSASPYAGEPDAEDGTDPGDDTLNDGVEGDASDEAPEDGGGSANESRSRRRGRRGRRGGSRRSRGRGRDSAAGTDAAAPSNAEPPSPPPPGSAPSD